MRVLFRLLLLSAGFPFGLTPASGQTNVGGTLSTNTTWSLSGSPYIVQTDVIVSQGVQLLIDPGVEVRFRKGRTLVVHGLLRAVGTADKYVHMVPDTTGNLEDFWWSGIFFSSTATQFNFNSQQGCLLKYCRLSWAGIPNLVADPTGQTAFAVYAQISLGVINSIIEYSACGLIASGGSQISNNKFLFNTSDLYSGPLVKVGQNSVIAHNLFYNNAIAATNGMLSLEKNIKVFNNIFAANAFIDFYPAMTFKDSCLFYLNTVVDNSLLRMELKGGLLYNNTIYRNQFNQHTVELDNCNPTFFANNISVNTGGIPGMEVEMVAANGSNTAAVPLNYWGFADSADIADHITDHHDNNTLCTLQFTPFAPTPDTLAPIHPPAKVRKGINWSNGKTYVTWNSNTEADLNGYVVYYNNYTGYSFANKLIAGNVNFVELDGVSALTEIAVTAFDHNADGTNDQLEGHESWFTLAEADSTVGLASLPDPGPLFFPNPTTGWIALQAAPGLSALQVRVYDLSGNLIASCNSAAGCRLQLPAGIFVAHVVQPNHRKTLEKIVVIPGSVN